MSTLVCRSLPTPVGVLRLVATDVALTGVWFPDHRHVPVAVAEAVAKAAAEEAEGSAAAAGNVAAHPILDRAARELTEYFAGKRTRFETPTAAEGTEFQRAVWRALAAIPYGERRSYKELAEAVGRPRAVRAVGAANARNPVSIFVGCHRVVAGDGALTGYAGGLAAKEWLLAHERQVVERAG